MGPFTLFDEKVDREQAALQFKGRKAGRALYELLETLAPNPMVTLNRAVAVAEVSGPVAGLELLATLDDDPRLAGNHRLPAVRAHLLERAGQTAPAIEAYDLAARLTSSLPERRYLTVRADRLSQPSR